MGAAGCDKDVNNNGCSALCRVRYVVDRHLPLRSVSQLWNFSTRTCVLGVLPTGQVSSSPGLQIAPLQCLVPVYVGSGPGARTP